MARFRRRIFVLAILALSASSGAALAQATITIVNNDGAGEGFNDITAVAPVAGNPGTTLGQQRLNVFQAAADEWEGVIASPVEIRIGATLDPLTPCTATSGILGSAGTNQVFRDYPGAPLPNTWYSAALANSISGLDNGPGNEDILARFNSSVDNATCLGPVNWFYGIGAAAPAGSISFFDTVKHELGHGLGVQSFVDIVTTGQLFQGRNDVFTNLLHDHSANANWPGMTNAERLSSAADTGDLHWIGARVNDCAQQIVTAGMSGGHVQMFAPGTIQPGSSVSHFDTAVAPDELMEPFATVTSDQRLTDRLLADIGWDVTSPTCGPVHSVILSPNVHSPRLSPVVHSDVVSRIHLIRESVLHVPIGSRQHPLVLSSGHDLQGSFGHNLLLSRGHGTFLSSPHGFVSSRIDFDPRGPVINPTGPFGGQFGGMPQMLQGGPMMAPAAPSYQSSPSLQAHNQIISMGHDPSLSFGHDPLWSRGHQPFTSWGHEPLFSWHDPFQSRGHDPRFSWHEPLLSEGHVPAISWHSPILSNPHNIRLSRQHWIVPSWVVTEPPVLDPGLMDPAHQSVPSAQVGSGGSVSPMPPGAVSPETASPQPAPTVPPNAPEGFERIPGNRAGVASPGIMPGDPYTVPQQ